MQSGIGIRAQVAMLFFTTLNVAVFTVVVYVVMLSPTLNVHAGYWMLFSMIGSALITAPLCWLVAPRVSGKLRKRLVAERSPLSDAPSRPV
ncbi:hypothetical protein [Pseudolabrys taiwanensis]|nr:hypothetical protein [Pseudolabrys taiwanensis]